MCLPSDALLQHLPSYLGFSYLGQAAATGALSAAVRSYPMSEVRGGSREDPVPEGWRPRGVTPRPRSGAVAESARLRWRRNGREEGPHVRGQGRRREELPCVQGQGRRPGGATPHSHARGQGRRPGGATPRPRPGVAAGRTNPTSKKP